jgi:predicted transcriptional regulator of viral defense system
MDPIIKYFNGHKGYALMKDMKTRGFQTRDIQKLVKERRITKLKPGVYRLGDVTPGESSGLVEVCLAIPKAIICLSSALAFHELTTFVPTSVSYAIPRSDKPIKLMYPPTEAFYFSERQYRGGLEHQDTKDGHIRIYGIEKTICDCFRFRNKLGEDIAMEGLKTYLKQRNRDLNRLMKYATMCRVEGILSQYVKAILG